MFFLTVTLSGTVSSTVKESMVRKYPGPVPDFKGRDFNLSPLRILTVGLSYMAFIVWSMNLSKLREIVKHRQAWPVAVHGAANSQT